MFSFLFVYGLILMGMFLLLLLGSFVWTNPMYNDNEFATFNLDVQTVCIMHVAIFYSGIIREDLFLYYMLCHWKGKWMDSLLNRTFVHNNTSNSNTILSMFFFFLVLLSSHTHTFDGDHNINSLTQHWIGWLHNNI